MSISDIDECVEVGSTGRFLKSSFDLNVLFKVSVLVMGVVAAPSSVCNALIPVLSLLFSRFYVIPEWFNAI